LVAQILPLFTKLAVYVCMDRFGHWLDRQPGIEADESLPPRRCNITIAGKEAGD
jgi:hypothetical protein